MGSNYYWHYKNGDLIINTNVFAGPEDTLINQLFTFLWAVSCCFISCPVCALNIYVIDMNIKSFREKTIIIFFKDQFQNALLILLYILYWAIVVQFSLTKIVAKHAVCRFTKLIVWFTKHSANHTLCVCFQFSFFHLPFVSCKCPSLPESADQCPLCKSLRYLTSGSYTECYYASHSCGFCAWQLYLLLLSSSCVAISTEYDDTVSSRIEHFFFHLSFQEWSLY